MANDGKVKIGVELDTTSFDSSWNKVKTTSKTNAQKVADDADVIKDAFEEAAETIEDDFKDGFEEAEDASKKFKNQTKDDADDVEDKWKKAYTEMENSSTTSFQNAAKAAGVAAVAIGAAIAGLAVSGVQYNASMQQYTTSFEVMLGSAEKAAAIMEDIKKIGATTPFEVPQLADSTQTLIAFGMSADQALNSLTKLGDIAQGDAQKLESLTLAYGKMNSAQKVTLEYLNIMIEQGFNPLNLIAEETGETMSDLYDRVSAGGVSFDEVTAAITKATSEGGQFFGSMEKQSQTLNGRISTLSDTFNDKLGQATEGITDILTNELIPAATEFIEDFDVEQISDKMDDAVKVGKVLLPIMVGLGTAYGGYRSIQLYASALDTAKKAQLLFNAAVSANPLGLAVIAITAITAAAITYIETMEEAEEVSEITGRTHEENTDRILDEAEAYKELIDARNDTIEAGYAELDYMDEQANELQNLLNKQGELTDAEKARADFLTGELANALNLEKSQVEALAASTSGLTDEIGNLIQARQAELLLSANEELVNEAIMNKAEAYKELGLQQLEYDRIAAESAAAEAERQNYLNELVTKYGENWSAIADKSEIDTASNLAVATGALEGQVNAQAELLAQAENTYTNYLATIQANEEATAAFLNQDYSGVIEQFAGLNSVYENASIAADESAQSQIDAAALQFATNLAALEAYEENYLAGVAGYTEAGLEEARRAAAESYIEYQKLGGNIVDGAVNGININKYKSIEAVKAMAAEMNEAFRNTLDINSPSKVFEDSGAEIDNGIVAGIEKKKPAVLKSMTSLAQDIAKVNIIPGGTTNNSSIDNSKTTSVNQNFYGQVTSPYDAFKAMILQGN